MMKSLVLFFLSITTSLSFSQNKLENMKIIKDVDYLAEQNYADDKDKLDIYMPKDAKNVPVIFICMEED